MLTHELTLPQTISKVLNHKGLLVIEFSNGDSITFTQHPSETEHTLVIYASTKITETSLAKTEDDHSWES